MTNYILPRISPQRVAIIPRDHKENLRAHTRTYNIIYTFMQTLQYFTSTNDNNNNNNNYNNNECFSRLYDFVICE